jgi:hypothetical protein
MIAESVISLLPIIISYTTTLLRHHRQRSRSKVFQPVSPREANTADDDYFDPTDEDEDDPEIEPPERLVPMSWVWSGLAVSGVLGVGLVWMVFGADGIHPWATAVGLVLASALSLIGVRALGETDLNPVSEAMVQTPCPCPITSGADATRYLALARSVNSYSPCCSRATLSPTSSLAESPKLARSSESNLASETNSRWSSRLHRQSWRPHAGSQDWTPPPRLDPNSTASSSVPLPASSSPLLATNSTLPSTRSPDLSSRYPPLVSGSISLDCSTRVIYPTMSSPSCSPLAPSLALCHSSRRSTSVCHPPQVGISGSDTSRPV